jgi:hypothetical protein
MSGRWRRSSEQGAGGCSAEKRWGWCAQRRADQEKWWLALGILSGGRVRECMGQLMGWQKMGQTAHVMFFFVFSFLFSFFGLALLDYISIFFYFYILVRRHLALCLTT